MDDPILSTRQDALDLVLQHLRLVGVLALDSVDESGQSAARTLRHILRLYSNSSFRQFVDVPAELARLLVHREKDRASCITTEPRVLELIRFFADEAIPGDALKTLALCDSSLAFQPELLPVLHTILARGAATGCELSTSLLRIKRARLKLGQPFTVNAEDNHINDCNESSKQIWKRMARGMVVVEK